jgi:non-canonical (house-cleaning) NTP pyrophosphatase
MGKILVAVGSKRRPKLEALREALDLLGAALDREAQFEVVAEEVASGVRHTPLSREEIMEGARRRAEALVVLAREQLKPWTYFVGLEGGMDVVAEGERRLVFLQNWAYVTDGNRRGFYGQSGGILLPEELARSVVDEGVELAAAIDAFASGSGIRDAEGAWGVLTRSHITRRDSYRVAIINAFAPFFNAGLYGEK